MDKNYLSTTKVMMSPKNTLLFKILFLVPPEVDLPDRVCFYLAPLRLARAYILWMGQ